MSGSKAYLAVARSAELLGATEGFLARGGTGDAEGFLARGGGATSSSELESRTSFFRFGFGAGSALTLGAGAGAGAAGFFAGFRGASPSALRFFFAAGLRGASSFS